MNVAALSVDGNPTYAWFVPLAALMWRQVAGYGTLVLVAAPVGVSGGLDERLLDEMRAAGARVRDCAGWDAAGRRPANPRASGGAAAQLLRLFACADPDVSPDDYLLTSDADMWPLAGEPFRPSGAAADLLYPESADRAETPYFSICYAGARASAWREFMKVEADAPERAVADLYGSDAALLGGHDGWNYDETLMTRRLKAWARFREVRVVRRRGDPPVDRVDRAAWPARPPARAVDAHLLRPGWTDENWPRIRPLLEGRLDATSLAWADDYRARWAERLGSGR